MLKSLHLCICYLFIYFLLKYLFWSVTSSFLLACLFSYYWVLWDLVQVLYPDTLFGDIFYHSVTWADILNYVHYIIFKMIFLEVLYFCFTFCSMIHFELIFAYDVSSTSKSTYLSRNVQFFQSHVWNRLFFLYRIAFTFICWKLVDPVCIGLFLDSVLVHWSVCLFLH